MSEESLYRRCIHCILCCTALLLYYFKTIALRGSYCLSGVQGHETSWFPCTFTDEREVKKSDGATEIQFTSREAVLQFGKQGDAPANPHVITFLVTGKTLAIKELPMENSSIPFSSVLAPPAGSKLNLQRYIQGVEPDRVECGLHWHKLQDVHVPWPAQQANEFSNWLSCTIKHTDGDFTLTSFLRHPTDQPPSTQGSRIWPAISDRQMVTTTGLDLISTLN